MTWHRLLNANSVRAHRTSKQELDDLRMVIDRDFHDAAISGLSADRSLATSHNTT
jgi:hypothetical protein